VTPPFIPAIEAHRGGVDDVAAFAMAADVRFFVQIYLKALQVRLA